MDPFVCLGSGSWPKNATASKRHSVIFETIAEIGPAPIQICCWAWHCSHVGPSRSPLSSCSFSCLMVFLNFHYCTSLLLSFAWFCISLSSVTCLGPRQNSRLIPLSKIWCHLCLRHFSPHLVCRIHLLLDHSLKHWSRMIWHYLGRQPQCLVRHFGGISFSHQVQLWATCAPSSAARASSCCHKQKANWNLSTTKTQDCLYET